MGDVLFVMSRGPGGINAQEGFDALLTGSAFTRCSVLFLGDGLFQLIRGQDPGALGSRNFTLGFGALMDYGVEQIYCSATELETAGLASADLILDAEALADDAVRALFLSHSAILSF
ncbi:MAG: sulfurtransferase complex subunit TusC [Proteobacteria bacterium]|nr:sulfurtransferase complex subunit TusC [Pseudomonadota bacterium]